MATILIVDDDQGLARLIEKVVRREGHTTAIALSGQEAIAWLEKNTVDLVLLDLKLPDVQAHELIGRFAQLDHTFPFIIITGQGDERVAVDMMKRGALDYLVKDVQFLDMLPMVVRRTLTHLDHERRLAAAEKSLQKEHAFSDAVLAASGALLSVIDAEGRIVRFNRACERLSGYTLEEVRGKHFWKLFLSQADWELAAKNITDIVAHPHVREIERYLFNKKGERKIVSWTLTALPGPESRVEFIIASGIDITERKQLEREILEVSGREQKRIGQDLHDGLCQLLAGIDMLLNVLHKRIAQKSPGDADAVAGISTYVKQAIQQARMLARGLSPVELEANGLMSALHELALSTGALFNVSCVFEHDQEVLMKDNVRATHLYRIAQEAINNAVKHGRAKNIHIKLAAEGEDALLTITDDGAGIKPNAMRSNGMGLRSMKYRAGLIEGDLKLSPTMPRGTVVSCSFGLKNAPEKIRSGS